MSMRYQEPETERWIVASDEQPSRALNAHAVPTDGMFMSQQLLSGSDDKGLEFTLDLSLGSSALVLHVEKGGVKRREVLDTQELVRTWVGLIVGQIDSGNLSAMNYVYEDDGTPAPNPRERRA